MLKNVIELFSFCFDEALIELAYLSRILKKYSTLIFKNLKMF